MRKHRNNALTSDASAWMCHPCFAAILSNNDSNNDNNNDNNNSDNRKSTSPTTTAAAATTAGAAVSPVDVSVFVREDVPISPTAATATVVTEVGVQEHQ